MLIKLENITKEYHNDDIATPVLKNINLSVREGEFLAIMGPSGSGKSTLMHIMGFLDRPTAGEYFFEGENTTNFTDDELARIRNERVGFVFQSFNLLPRTTVLNNVKLPLVYTHGKNIHGLAEKAIAAVGLGHRADYFTNQISGGEKQRVAIARALVNTPSVIFADEPTGNLDSKSGGAVMHILQELHRQGHTIILVTHEMDTAEHAERLIKIKDGMIMDDQPITARRIAEPDGAINK
ncbi:macrolide ABC transporter ATP-binding protein [Candidatus Nomurabacteria bacterium RIFCSPLOWO2_12_FULL_46_14]|uniref:Macrolide ABC transporter ATP-binding protein n=1 Tax=Candidatus Nomurabacteria bacterium RIFCSPLOWO2_12_FULL_46_14 TaxID=1801797 RepID=A0A1F6Y895_9BACT|nr:MAG: macrolide ABC transporter ATP-binding protein [Candidatus Nomurabacteria bacterium RIFCSPLOWO2_12_FULL_46_14]